MSHILFVIHNVCGNPRLFPQLGDAVSQWKQGLFFQAWAWVHCLGCYGPPTSRQPAIRQQFFLLKRRRHWKIQNTAWQKRFHSWVDNLRQVTSTRYRSESTNMERRCSKQETDNKWLGLRCPLSTELSFCASAEAEIFSELVLISQYSEEIQWNVLCRILRNPGKFTSKCSM